MDCLFELYLVFGHTLCYFTFMPFVFNLTPEERNFLRRCGRKGGMKRNPKKGFGTPGNARKAAFARWNKAKKKP